jgi:hypothetical protein
MDMIDMTNGYPDKYPLWAIKNLLHAKKRIFMPAFSVALDSAANWPRGLVYYGSSNIKVTSRMCVDLETLPCVVMTPDLGVSSKRGR